MKKIILISFLIAAFTLVGCNHNTAEPPKSDPNPEKTVDRLRRRLNLRKLGL